MKEPEKVLFLYRQQKTLKAVKEDVNCSGQEK